MAIDDVCDPNKNQYLGGMLSLVGFDYKTARKIDFINPKTKEVTGSILYMSREDSVLILHQGLCTSVIAHIKEKAEIVEYLGSLVPGEFPVLKYKYQNDYATDRNESHDEILEFSFGQTFTTIGQGRPGLWHGYHNTDPKNPIALRIRKAF